MPGVQNLWFKFSFIRFLEQQSASSFTLFTQGIPLAVGGEFKEKGVPGFIVASAINFTEFEEKGDRKTKALFFSEILWNYGVGDKKLQSFYSSYFFSLLDGIQKREKTKA